jgi:hypothetical protein
MSPDTLKAILRLLSCLHALGAHEAIIEFLHKTYPEVDFSMELAALEASLARARQLEQEARGLAIAIDTVERWVASIRGSLNKDEAGHYVEAQALADQVSTLLHDPQLQRAFVSLRRMVIDALLCTESGTRFLAKLLRAELPMVLPPARVEVPPGHLYMETEPEPYWKPCTLCVDGTDPVQDSALTRVCRSCGGGRVVQA